MYRMVSRPPDLGDEAIAPCMNGLDETRTARVVAELGADLANANLQHGLADDDVRPGLAVELAFRDEPPGASHEMPQHTERLRLQRDRRVAPPQPLVPRVE